ncbi:MAG: VOC family protein [Ktedonobacterales bacterium]|nr:VOC family protein [Ktedonobacterales bacterium]
MSSTKLGHVHLKVHDLERAVAFYTRFFDLRETERVADHYSFLTSDGCHHEIALQHVGPEAPVPPPTSTGLYHVAFEVPTRRAFAEAYAALVGANVSVATVDHLISWAMYFDDPDGNGLEIYWDTRHEPGGRDLWHGENHPLPVATILRALRET